MQSYDVIIIGGGVVGSAVARELTRYQLSIAVLEKESDVCCQTSGRNTGMLHAGFLYKTGSLKAQCAVEGNAEFDRVAEELDVPFKRTGKLIVGFTEEHRERLKTMIARGEGGSWPYIELAKYYEHVRRDYDKALRCATAALQYTLNTMPLNGEDETQTAPVFKRIERLKRKQKACQGGSLS